MPRGGGSHESGAIDDRTLLVVRTAGDAGIPGEATGMRAARFHGVGDLRLEEIPLPVPRAGEVRIRPLAVGVCGTDVHIFRGEFPSARPVVLGHEIAGTVDAAGSAVKGIREGDLVTVQPNTFCGVCRYCRLGREHLCLEMRAYGVHMDGGFAAAMVASAKTVYRLPVGLEARIGCFAEPLACALHGMDRLGVSSASTVLVIGAGAVGLMLARLSCLAGAGLVAVSEPHADRRAAALSFGAGLVADPGAEGWRESLMEATAGQGFDSVIDAVGGATTFEQAVSLTARGGKVLVFGVAPPDAAAAIRPYEIFSRELTVIGTLINPYTHERAVQILPQMGLDKFSVEALPLARLREALDAHAGGRAAIKIQILPQE
jgi:2-desacetyl-2-hydroxyethyl bacteriochlorophyllide A dehydrogenase